jgi:uncharacterized protein
MDTLIPLNSLAKPTLMAILEDIVTREGTDYGDLTFTVVEKVQQVHHLLQAGQAFLLFDTDSETIKLISKEQLSQSDLSY